MEPISEEKSTAVPPTPPTPPVPTEPVAPRGSMGDGWLVVGVVVVIVLLTGAFFAIDRFGHNVTDEPVLTAEEEDMVWRPHKDFVSDATSSVDYGGPAATSSEVVPALPPDKKRPLYEVREATVIAPYDAQVEWLSSPREVARETVPVEVDEYSPKVLYVGKVVDNGALSGMDLYIIYEEGMGVFPTLYAISSSSVVAINKEWPFYFGNSPYWVEDEVSGFSLRRDEYMVPATLQDIVDRSVEYGGEVKPLRLASDLSGVGGQLYQYEQCFFGETPSGLLAEYLVDIPFIENGKEGGYGTPSISFNRLDGTFASAEYEIYDRVSYGCGSLCSPLKVVERNDSDFVKTGTTADGSSLFALKDPRDPLMQELYNQPNTRAFVDTSAGSYEPLEKNKYSYDEYVRMSPLLFWKDQLGRWVKFVHSEFLILAEKCKPVIYLYPEEEMDVSVTVKPNLGFTKTIPEYGEGWNVTAKPDGSIIDKKTGTTYPYLYWTGWVEGYPLIERGWVVPQQDLDAFFDRYLPKFGMMGKEIEDFKEYWEEDMDDAPYYAVTFVDQRVIDDLSPLNVSGDPDVVIRVLMTAQPLLRPVPLEAPVLREAPARHGFTVVEWGGTILRANEVPETR